MSIDLHIHTTASDGDIDPVSVVRQAAAAGLRIISITDHESTSGFPSAHQEGLNHGITVIAGVELLSFYKEKEIHLLGYYRDLSNKYLQEELAELRQQRTKCAEQSVKILKEYGFNVSWDDVKRLTQYGGPVSKGHIMQAIYNCGYIKNHDDAKGILCKYLNREGLAYTCHQYPFEQALDLIKSTGGIPILAHPGLIRDDSIVEELCLTGIMGIEVFYFYFGSNREERIQKYLSMAEKKEMLMTGGSDYHGTITSVKLHENRVPHEGIKDFLYLFGIC